MTMQTRFDDLIDKFKETKVIKSGAAKSTRVTLTAEELEYLYIILVSFPLAIKSLERHERGTKPQPLLTVALKALALGVDSLEVVQVIRNEYRKNT